MNLNLKWVIILTLQAPFPTQPPTPFYIPLQATGYRQIVRTCSFNIKSSLGDSRKWVPILWFYTFYTAKDVARQWCCWWVYVLDHCVAYYGWIAPFRTFQLIFRQHKFSFSFFFFLNKASSEFLHDHYTTMDGILFLLLTAKDLDYKLNIML